MHWSIYIYIGLKVALHFGLAVGEVSARDVMGTVGQKGTHQVSMGVAGTHGCWGIMSDAS